MKKSPRRHRHQYRDNSQHTNTHLAPCGNASENRAPSPYYGAGHPLNAGACGARIRSRFDKFDPSTINKCR